MAIRSECFGDIYFGRYFHNANVNANYFSILNYKGSWLDWVKREGKDQAPPASS